MLELRNKVKLSLCSRHGLGSLLVEGSALAAAALIPLLVLGNEIFKRSWVSHAPRRRKRKEEGQIPEPGFWRFKAVAQAYAEEAGWQTPSPPGWGADLAWKPGLHSKEERRWWRPQIQF